jgi:Flp pilus assembly protein TadD
VGSAASTSRRSEKQSNAGPQSDTRTQNSSRDLHMQNLPRPNAVPPTANERLKPVDFNGNHDAGGGDKSTMTTESRIPTEPHDVSQVPKVQLPSGVAWLNGRALSFPSSVRLIPGERVAVEGRPYEIKRARILTPKSITRWAAYAVLGILAAIGLAHIIVGPPGGTISGVVIDGVSGRIIPDARISIINGPMVRTNSAGLFAAGGLPTGQFTLTATAIGYQSQSGTVMRTGGLDAQMAFVLAPLSIDTALMLIAEGTPAEPAPVEETPAEETRTSGLAFGHVKIDADFSDFLVFVDNVLYGKNTPEVKRLSAGNHAIVLQVDGFEDFASSVTVKARATETLKVRKADLTPQINPLKRARGHFAEAKAFLEQGQWPAAIDEYTKGLEYEPENADALQYRGWAFLKSGNAVKAKSDFVRAAQLHHAANRNLDAVTCAGYLIELEPGESDHCRRRAEYYIALSEFDKAIDDYKSAIKRDKNAIAPRLGLAEAHFATGDFREAAKEFDRARKLTDKPSSIYVRMLIALTNAGLDKDVRKKYEELTQIADPAWLESLRQDPEWLRVLQIVDPSERSSG